MAIGNQIKGVSRDTSNSYSKVNGIWRENIDTWTKVKGIWRSTNNQPIDAKDIIGFNLIYSLNASRIHHDYPKLKYNSNIPYIMKLTGDTIGSLDFNKKGVVFEYSNKLPEEEGTVIYEGRLYAILVSGTLVNVGRLSGTNTNKEHEDEMNSEFSTIYEVEKVNKLDIKITGYVLFEDYGYYFAGWNNLFNTKPFIDKTIYPNKTQYKKRMNLNSYNILPSYTRDEYFDSCATIGIARDMHSVPNLIGAHGLLDHTISTINLNGTDMPFVISIM